MRLAARNDPLRIFALLTLFLFLTSCAGNMRHMTTYEGAASAFKTDACGQFCWAKYQSKSGTQACQNEAASIALSHCTADLSSTGDHFVDKDHAQEQLRQCMERKGWWRITAFIIICD